MIPLDPRVERVLARGEMCHLAARTDRGPHLTPMVFALSGGSLWVTTSRASVKRRAWRDDPVVGGLVRDGDDAVAFTGTVRTYDLLDSATWPDVLGRSAVVTAASLRFSRKNARFFAGYAVDARHVPLAWTPPGRVFVEIDLTGAALLRGGAVRERIGDLDAGAALASRAGFRSVTTVDAFVALPAHVRRVLGDAGDGALALDGPSSPVVIPVRWALGDGPILATASGDAVALADAGPSGPATIGIDNPSWWRARRMLGCMVQGTADRFAPSVVRTGRRALGSAIARAGGDPERDALVRLRPTRAVWWEGWTSGSSSVA